MRVKLLFFGVLALLVGACSPTSTGTNAPPPLDKHLLTGKWKNDSESQLVQGYEFAEDGALKVTILGMDAPLAGRYAWNGERTIGMEFQLAPEVGQAYEAAAKAYKDNVMDQIKTGKLSDRAGPSILGTVHDQWPTSETLKVALSEKPPLLILGNDAGFTQHFNKVD
ncbi:MAG TPA: hypothetical protein VGG61_00260 [Gemmataceae bacterium]|jgi:hypothetical protein